MPGGFAAVYKVLSAFEESGRCRRGYFVAGLGAAQFGTTGAVDRLRSMASEREPRASSTPPDRRSSSPPPIRPTRSGRRCRGRSGPATTPTAGHRPGRKAGAIVVLVDGSLALYVERGGRTLLTFTHDPLRIQPAADALALAVRDGALGRLTVERADGEHILGSPLVGGSRGSRFHALPRVVCGCAVSVPRRDGRA